MKRTFWCIPVFLLFCILSVKADVLGPYIMDSNVPDTPAGYGRIVLPISGVYVPVNASITVCDEGGKQYVLTACELGFSILLFLGSWNLSCDCIRDYTT